MLGKLIAVALLGPAPCVTREASAMVLLFLLNTNYTNYANYRKSKPIADY